MSEELKACAHCGGEAELDQIQGYRTFATGRLGHRVAIYCTACNSDMGMCREDTPELSTEDLVAILVEQWNTRTPDPTQGPLHVDYMNDFVLIGLARDAAEAKAQGLVGALRECIEMLECVGDGACGRNCEREGGYETTPLIAKSREALSKAGVAL